MAIVGIFGPGGGINWIPNSNFYMRGKRIIQLPYEWQDVSEKARRLFIEAMRSSASKKFAVLIGEELEEDLKKVFQESQKHIPPGHWTEKVMFMIKSTGAIVFVIIAAKIGSSPAIRRI